MIFILILCVTNVTKWSYFYTGSVKLCAKHGGEVLGVVWEHIVSDNGSATAKNRESLGFFLS